MNIYLVFILLVISETKSYHDDTSYRKDAEENGVLLRKLQNLQEHDSRNVARTASWSEILANVLVKRIFSFRKPNNESGRVTSVEDEKNLWVRSFSYILRIYKKYLYDKLKYDRNKLTSKPDNGAGVNETVSETELNKTEVIDNPNDEVEIIEPKYHGKLCDDCDNIEIEVNDKNECEKDFIMDANGNCVAKSSKFILSVPSQCPIGYRRDWLGYCRVTL